MDEKKDYANDFEKTVKGVLILLAVGLSVWGITALLGFKDDTPVRRSPPTQAEIDQWNREINDCQYSDRGCEWDNRWGQ